MLNKTAFAFAILFLGSCNTSQYLSITNVHDMAAFSENSYFFALPRTRINITITALSHYTVPGPYSQYAEKLLGIIDAPSISQTVWEINTIQQTNINETDPDYIFCLKTNSPELIDQNIIKLTEQGLIVNVDKTNPFVQFHGESLSNTEPHNFTDLSVKKNFYTETRKAKSKDGKPVIPIDLPESKLKQGLKTTEEKAIEAANFIIKIRKRRFKLVSGEFEVYPEGAALSKGIVELNQLEQEYLSLFIGKTYTDTIIRTYSYIPAPGAEIDRNVICRFSDETGFDDPQGISGKPLVLEIKNYKLTAALENLQMTDPGPVYENLIFYRIPDVANLILFIGSVPVLESETNVYQYGSLVPFTIINMKSKK